MEEIDDKPMWDLVAGLTGYHAVTLAYDLGIFNILSNEPKSAIEVSEKLNIQMRPVEAILNVNLNLGFIVKQDDGYSLSELGKKYLLKSSPTYFGGLLDLIVHNEFTYEKLKKAALSNKPQEYGQNDIFLSHEQNMELAKKFTYAMHSISVAPASRWVSNLDLSEHEHFLDIGGGSGAHLISALTEWPNMKGTVLDIDPVCEVSEKYLNRNDLSSRANTHAGDFWNCEFPNADIHFYSQIFHDWPEEKCQFLSDKSFKSMPKGGKIVIHEILIDDDKEGPFTPVAVSIAGLTWTEGKQYTGKEIRNILENSGFVNTRVISSFGYWGLIVGEK